MVGTTSYHDRRIARRNVSCYPAGCPSGHRRTHYDQIMVLSTLHRGLARNLQVGYDRNAVFVHGRRNSQDECPSMWNLRASCRKSQPPRRYRLLQFVCQIVLDNCCRPAPRVATRSASMSIPKTCKLRLANATQSASPTAPQPTTTTLSICCGSGDVIRACRAMLYGSLYRQTVLSVMVFRKDREVSPELKSTRGEANAVQKSVNDAARS